MREYAFQIHPFSFTTLLGVTVQKHPNEHPTAIFSGYIKEEDNALIERWTADQRIVLTACGEDGEKRIVFQGIAQELQDTVENGLHKITVHAIADTVYMDMDKHTRTFQNSSATYAQILDILGEVESRFGFICPNHGALQIERMLVQYRETDWAFCIRLASRLHTQVIPNCTIGSPYLSIGVPGNGIKYTVAATDYTISKDAGAYQVCVNNGVQGLSERDAMSYHYESREIYDLCDQITLNDHPLYVYSVVSRLDGAELIHDYTLKEKSGFFSKEHFNEKLIGASLTGSAKKIEAEQIQVEINDDVKQSRYKWFSYATAYSSSDGTGWYFMPEEGDEIRLSFPTDHEEDAYVISSVHITHGDRGDPDTKFVRTKQGKEIVFKPESIFITNGAGSSILLSDKSGIEMKTSKKMKLTASENITISGQGKVIVRGNLGVDVKQNDSLIEIAENVAISSGHTRMR